MPVSIELKDFDRELALYTGEINVDQPSKLHSQAFSMNRPYSICAEYRAVLRGSWGPCGVRFR